MRHISGISLTVLVFSVFSAVNAIADGALRFVTLEFAPFIYGENQQVAGPGRDVIAAVCEQSKVDCSFDIYPWRRAQALIKDGRADGMMVIGRNPAREEWLRFSPPMFRTEYGFFVRSDNPMEFNDLQQLAGFRVGVFAPSNTATQLEGVRARMIENGIPPIVVDGHPDDAAGLRKLASGRLDAVYSNRDRGRGILAEEALTGDVRYAGAHQKIQYYAGINKDFPNQDVVDEFFRNWRDLFLSGKAQRIIEGYGLEPAQPE